MAMTQDTRGVSYRVMWPKVWMETSVRQDSLLSGETDTPTNLACGHSFHGGDKEDPAGEEI